MTITLPIITAFTDKPANDDRPVNGGLAPGAPPHDGSIAPARPGQDRWPLLQEFRRGGFGDDDDGDRLWAAVKWVERLASIADPLASSSALAAAQDNPPGVPGTPIHAIDKSTNLSALLPLEAKARAFQLLTRLAARLGRHGWLVLRMAIFDRAEMRAIGEALGTRGKETAPAAGRGALIMALATTADARDLLAEMENTAPDRAALAVHFGAANDNLPARRQAA